MTDLRYEDAVLGPAMITFDGRILELFTERGASEQRMIVGMLNVDVGEPNRKGRREVKFTCGTGFRSGGGFTIWAEEHEWANLEPFVREVRAAL